MSESDQKDSHGERRKKTTFDWVAPIGGVGSIGIGAIVVNLLLHQNSVLDLHSDLIKGNSNEQEQTLGLLKEMRSEFKLDIQTFKMRHANLQGQLENCKVEQKSFLDRLLVLERTNLNQFDIRRWVEDNFQRRTAK